MIPAPASTPPVYSGTRAQAWLAAGLLAGVALLAYANSFHGPFVFDDVPSIVENPTIRQLWPPGEALSPHTEGGVTVSGRPILNLSLAVNYAISGLDPWSYHALNLLIHLLAGLTLFGLVRRTLARPPLAAQYGGLAWPLALVIAALWLVHPLQTESVTFIVQRAESLMGLFFLLTLYTFARAADSPHPGRWRTLSLLACLLGAGTKEVTALAPVLVFLYDRTFVSGSFKAAWQRHRWWHLALAATWLPLAWLMVSTGGNRGGTIGFDVGVPWVGYWLTQFMAVCRYLWLSFWPHPLVFDYGEVVAPTLAEALPWAVLVLLLVAATLFALWRRPAAGFLGAWFFGILAPTSIMPGSIQMVVEHRMYLPLAAVITLVAGAAAPRLGRRGLLLAGAGLALAAGAITWQRNKVYPDEEVFWQDIIAKRPVNARAHNNLGRHYYGLGRWDEAIACYRESLRLQPRMAVTHYNLGLALRRAGRLAEAVDPLQTAVRLLPEYFTAHLNLGIVLTRLGRAEEALPHFAAALRHDPWPAEIHFQGGIALAQLGRWPEAIAHYARCLQLNPRHAEAQSNWGTALMAMKSIPEAVAHFETALRLRPEMTEVHFNLGQAYRALDRRADAIAQYTETIRLNPAHALAHLNLGIALAQEGKLPEALGHLQEAVRLQPASPDMHANLAVALDLAGRPAEAQAHFEQAEKLRAKP
jgi:tetratricopeptide (TPR) repeat protein